MGWLKNTSGNPDSMFTFAVIAFAVVTAKILLAGWTLGWGDKNIEFHAMDAGMAGVYLGATFTAYWARKHTKSQENKTNGETEKS